MRKIRVFKIILLLIFTNTHSLYAFNPVKDVVSSITDIIVEPIGTSLGNGVSESIEPLINRIIYDKLPFFVEDTLNKVEDSSENIIDYIYDNTDELVLSVNNYILSLKDELFFDAKDLVGYISDEIDILLNNSLQTFVLETYLQILTITDIEIEEYLAKIDKIIEKLPMTDKDPIIAIWEKEAINQDITTNKYTQYQYIKYKNLLGCTPANGLGAKIQAYNEIFRSAKALIVYGEFNGFADEKELKEDFIYYYNYAHLLSDIQSKLY